MKSRKRWKGEISVMAIGCTERNVCLDTGNDIPDTGNDIRNKFAKQIQI